MISPNTMHAEPRLRFLNHASYIIETSDALLLHDPWFEGEVFNGGWALLSDDLTSQDVLELLQTYQKKIFLWVSHEHPDHLNMKFIKLLKTADIDFELFFQNTADRRVASFLRGLGVKVHECIEGREYELSEDLHLSVFRHSEGDSFSFVRAAQKTLLNLNDCVIDTSEEAKKVISRLPKNSNIDILLTQFGYASWLGVENDRDFRINAANEKIERIRRQNEVFSPSAVILFASFIYFCRSENYYLNCEQNSPSKIRSADRDELRMSNVFFMKPGDDVTLEDGCVEVLKELTVEAEHYWNQLFDEVVEFRRKPIIPDHSAVDIETLVILARQYRRRILKHLLIIPAIFEVAHLMKVSPIKFEIIDLDYVLEISYRRRPLVHKNRKADVRIKSADLAFALRENFGWNSVIVGGTFRSNVSSLDSYNSFFWYQDLVKNGVSFTAPKKFLSFLYELTRGLFERRLFAKLSTRKNSL